MSSTDIIRLGNYLRNEHPHCHMTIMPSEEHGTVFRIRLPNNTIYEVHANTYVLPAIEFVGDYVGVRGRIEAWIRQRHPEVNEWDCNGDLVLYGLVQAGKTELLLCMIWITQHVFGHTAVLVLANMVSSYDQVMQKNAREFNAMLTAEFGRDSAPFHIQSIGFKGRNQVDDKDHTWLRVCMGNPTQLQRIGEDIRGRPYVLFCDEADVHVKSFDDETDCTATGPMIRRMKEEAVSSVNITATPFAIYNQKDAIQKTLVMRKPPNYRGVEETEWVFSSEEDADRVRSGDSLEAIRMLDEMVVALRPRVDNGERKYMTILVNGPHTIQGQNTLACAIAQMRPRWGVYVMNSGGQHDNAVSTGRVDAIRQALPTGGMVSTGECMISKLYDLFEEINDGFRVCVIVACLKAARAISFRPTTRSNGTGGLHGMLFFPNASCHTAQLIQYMRPFGKYDPDYPNIRIRTTEMIYDRIRIEITHNLKAFAEATANMGSSREQIEGVEVMMVGRRHYYHDRPTVDDTVVADRTSLCKQEFATRELLMEFLQPTYGNRVAIMTDRLITVPKSQVPNVRFGSGIPPSEQNQMRRVLSQYVETHNGFQVCWHDRRYEELHDMRRRFQDQSTNYTPMVVAGSGDDRGDVIYAVVWKRQFSNGGDWSMERFQPNRAYIYQTSRGTWRFYATRELRHTGVLRHRD